MKKFLTIGEPLVVFSSNDLNVDLSNANHFTKHLAGAELNVATGLARLGINSNYITSLGIDPLGEYIEHEIHENGINTDYIYRDKKHTSGFYLKQKVDKGDPNIYYYRSNSASARFDPNMLNNIEMDDSFGIVHCSGIMAAISNNGFKSVEKLLKMADKNSIYTVFDPNIRQQLWSDKQVMKKSLNYLSSLSKIVIPGINECKILTGLVDPEQIANFYFNQSKITKIVIIKDGSKGAYIKVKDKPMDFVNSYQVNKVVDTVGAGDGFAVGLISGILEGNSLKFSVKRACAIGALAVQSKGDSDGYPTRNQLETFMEQENNKKQIG
jgi:2-dehydro-3-deoxygluconokinase